MKRITYYNQESIVFSSVLLPLLALEFTERLESRLISDRIYIFLLNFLSPVWLQRAVSEGLWWVPKFCQCQPTPVVVIETWETLPVPNQSHFPGQHSNMTCIATMK